MSDDSDDDWDIDSDEDDDALDAKLGLKKKEDEVANKFDDEVDLAVVEKERQAKLKQTELKKKGNALAARKQAEKDAALELQLAQEAARIEAEQEANMTPDQLRAHKRAQVKSSDNALAADLFGEGPVKATGGKAAAASDEVNIHDLVSCLKHARKVSDKLKKSGQIHWTKAFLEEIIKDCKEVLDDRALTELTKTCNIIKNEKVQAAKRKVKGEAQKSKKRDKEAERAAKKKHDEVFGENDQFDDYDQMGADYEDAYDDFF